VRRLKRHRLESQDGVREQSNGCVMQLVQRPDCSFMRLTGASTRALSSLTQTVQWSLSHSDGFAMINRLST